MNSEITISALDPNGAQDDHEIWGHLPRIKDIFEGFQFVFSHQFRNRNIQLGPPANDKEKAFQICICPSENPQMILAGKEGRGSYSSSNTT